jgi:TonB family protein
MRENTTFSTEKHLRKKPFDTKVRYYICTRIHNWLNMRLFLLGLILIHFSAISQNIVPPGLMKNWKKTDITRIDGSPYYDPETLNVDFDLNFVSKDSVDLFNNGRLQRVRYQVLEDSIIKVSALRMKIEELSDIKLVLSALESEELDFRLILSPRPLYDLTYTPEAYKAKNGEVVFISETGRVEPQFRHKTMTPVDFIFENFGFPEYRKGGFVVRFVVTSKGDVTGVKVVASSNNRYNDKLIQAVLKTKGFWEPAEFKGEKVSVEIEYDFNLGYEDRKITSQVDSIAYSRMYLDYGTNFIKDGAYRSAFNYLKKSIDYNPLNIDAYFKHAEVSFALKRKEEGCESLSYLLLLEQKKAVPLYEKYCK